MDANKPSPFPPAIDVQLHRNPPLAPSQELAYRNKCIQLKRRLAEIETNNDITRRRINAEKERVQKMRLLRAILLNQLKEIMETPGRKWKPEELEKMGIVINGNTEDEDQINPRVRPDGEVLLDDSSEDSDEDNPEPSDRPTRTKRQSNYRETIMSTQPNSTNATVYPPGLPAIAPASSYSPTTQREPLLATSYQTPVAAGSPTQHATQQQQQQQQQFIQDPRYAHSSPVHTAQPLQPSSSSRSVSMAHSQTEANGYSRTHLAIPQPVRPKVPYDQFCEHMRPQLEADNYPREYIQARIDEEWRKLSNENRTLWDERYNEQMREYEEAMDTWKRMQRRQNPDPVVVNPVATPTSSGFPVINRGV